MFLPAFKRHETVGTGPLRSDSGVSICSAALEELEQRWLFTLPREGRVR